MSNAITLADIRTAMDTLQRLDLGSLPKLYVRSTDILFEHFGITKPETWQPQWLHPAFGIEVHLDESLPVGDVELRWPSGEVKRFTLYRTPLVIEYR